MLIKNGLTFVGSLQKIGPTSLLILLMARWTFRSVLLNFCLESLHFRFSDIFMRNVWNFHVVLQFWIVFKCQHRYQKTIITSSLHYGIFERKLALFEENRQQTKLRLCLHRSTALSWWSRLATNFFLKNVEEFWHISNLNDHVIRIQDFRPHHGVPVSISKNAKSR